MTSFESFKNVLFGLMTALSVNINKVALLRNSRGGNVPDLIQFALDCERFGAQGITVHPRPDERHIRYSDCYLLRDVVKTEFNVEGFPDRRFMKLISEVKPQQCTLVPDAATQLTSDHGWDTINQKELLTDIVAEIKSYGVRVSLFLDPNIPLIEAAAETGTDRIELYTGPYAHDFTVNPEKAISNYRDAALSLNTLGLGLNAGHDLSLINLAFFKSNIPDLLEVSIGHALIRDALYFGIELTIQKYLQQLK